MGFADVDYSDRPVMVGPVLAGFLYIAWEGEAPAEPMRSQLGRSLALPLFIKLQRCLREWSCHPVTG